MLRSATFRYAVALVLCAEVIGLDVGFPDLERETVERLLRGACTAPEMAGAPAVLTVELLV